MHEMIVQWWYYDSMSLNYDICYHDRDQKYIAPKQSMTIQTYNDKWMDL